MFVKIIRDCRANGEHIEASDKPLEFSDKTARQLIAAGRAVAAEAPAKKPRAKKTAAKNAEKSVKPETEGEAANADD